MKKIKANQHTNLQQTNRFKNSNQLFILHEKYGAICLVQLCLISCKAIYQKMLDISEPKSMQFQILKYHNSIIIDTVGSNVIILKLHCILFSVYACNLLLNKNYDFLGKPNDKSKKIYLLGKVILDI